MKTITLSLIFLIPILTNSQILHIPDDYPTIQQGINAAIDGDTVLVDPGTYHENINFNGNNIVLASLFLATGDDSYIASTIIDGGDNGSVVNFENNEDKTSKISGFTIQNGYAIYGGGIHIYAASPIISNNIITNNEVFDTDGGKGGGIYCFNSDAHIVDNRIANNYASGPLGGYGGGIYCLLLSPQIERNIITQNYAGYGGGIYCINCIAIVRQNLITHNTGSLGGGGLFLDGADPVIINNTVTFNEADWWPGGGMVSEYSNPVITNTIFWENIAFQDPKEIYYTGGFMEITYCDVEGGWTGTGNVDEIPYFRDPINNDFHLMDDDYGSPFDSPLIDIGNPEIEDMVLDSLWGLGTILSDMGAYGGVDSVSMTGVNAVLKNQNQYWIYPNPVISKAAIGVQLYHSIFVQIDILDYSGQLIKNIIAADVSSGNYKFYWDAKEFSAGIYFCLFKTNDGIQTRKIVKL